MEQRVGFVHTVGFLVEEFRRRMQERLPQIDCFHCLNESLLQDLLRGTASGTDSGTNQAAVYRRVTQQILLARDAGATLIVVTCSSTSPAVDIARQLSPVPILKIDDPLASTAVEIGARIGLVCTASSTVGPSSALLRQHAQARGRAPAIKVALEPTAMAALAAGDRARHDAILTDAVRALQNEVDVIVLAQASMAHLAPLLAREITVPVLASPELIMQEIERRLAAAA